MFGFFLIKNRTSIPLGFSRFKQSKNITNIAFVQNFTSFSNLWSKSRNLTWKTPKKPETWTDFDSGISTAIRWPEPCQYRVSAYTRWIDYCFLLVPSIPSCINTLAVVRCTERRSDTFRNDWEGVTGWLPCITHHKCSLETLTFTVPWPCRVDPNGFPTSLWIETPVWNISG